MAQLPKPTWTVWGAYRYTPEGGKMPTEHSAGPPEDTHEKKWEGHVDVLTKWQLDNNTSRDLVLQLGDAQVFLPEGSSMADVLSIAWKTADVPSGRYVLQAKKDDFWYGVWAIEDLPEDQTAIRLVADSIYETILKQYPDE